MLHVYMPQHYLPGGSTVQPVAAPRAEGQGAAAPWQISGPRWPPSDNCTVKFVELLYVSIGIWVCTGFDDSEWGIDQWWEWNSNRHVKCTNNMQTVTKANMMCIPTRPYRSQRRSLMRLAADSVCRFSLSPSPTHLVITSPQASTGCWASFSLSGNLV